ncbi:ankyrin [Plenodomus tracheiphilus IPT5]|uniref:Ankyrin n=1 Tax=Plenodomus tracheiphilus IPT5 TaxID=1408161 RepID=A0A6A7ANP9_9PLEO|nr:ankyrin [Plenodomus tracheiphilus IPT5]
MSTEYNTRRTSVGNENDWREISDAAERRRAQNRIAQRNYRRNLKLRQQQFDQINENLASCSLDSTQRQALRLQSTVSDASTSTASSASVPDTVKTAPQSSTSFSHSWPDMMGTPSFLSEPAISTESLEALSLLPTLHESRPATLDGQVDCLARWGDMENSTSSFNSSMTRRASFSDPTPLTALQKSILRGQHSVAKLLAENGANIYVEDRMGNNILHLAVQSGSLTLVLFALRNGIDVNDTNMLGHTALHVAIERNDLEIIKILLSAGADIESKS